LKQMRDSGKYKEMGMTWATFCQERAGISRVSADRRKLFPFAGIDAGFRRDLKADCRVGVGRGRGGGWQEDSIYARESEAGDGGGGVATREGVAEV
jgi:hypothetical protein